VPGEDVDVPEYPPAIVFGFGDFTCQLLSPDLRQSLCLRPANFPGLLPTDDTDISGLTLDTILDMIDRRADSIGSDSFMLIGFSISGTVALDYTVLRPGRVSALVLLCSPPLWTPALREYQTKHQSLHLPEDKKAVLAKNLDELKQRGSSIPKDSLFAEQCIAQAPLYWHSSPSAYRSYVADLKVNMDLIMAFESPLYMGHDLSGRFREIGVPVFLSLGRHDYACPPGCWSLSESLPPNLHRVEFESSGHYPMIEERERFDRELSGWLCDLKRMD
jgi:proline iminopeptidase